MERKYSNRRNPSLKAAGELLQAGYVQRALTGPWGGAAKAIDTSGMSS